MWSVILMGVAGILGGGALSMRQQRAHISWIITAWALAGVALFGAYVLTL
ncbi:hypothetical protein [Paeniglutamicibacter antarcticus]|uniref:Uncharacterized protein n=1 Tax=Paeniglutamicibacter antarcticus TaxID=494023 RepID=A0ABP9TUS5_9MICC